MKLHELQQLPMDKASRLSRAKAMGFDTSTVWYHANTGGIEGKGFDNDRLPGGDPDAPFSAHWFIHTPTEFSAYPNTGNTITPVYLRLQKLATWTDMKKYAKTARGPDLRAALEAAGFDGMHWEGRGSVNREELTKTGQTIFWSGPRRSPMTLKWEKEKIRGETYDTLNLYDDGDPDEDGDDFSIGYITGYKDVDDFEDATPEKDTIAMFNTDSIRSIYAKFDPAKKGSGGLNETI